jgi:hypothetical protein
MIPDEAVESAAEAVYDREVAGFSTLFADAPTWRKAYFREVARTILEASAPCLWDEAYRAGHLDAASGVFRPWHRKAVDK